MEKIGNINSIKHFVNRSLLSLALLTTPILSQGCGRGGYMPENKDAIEQLEGLRSLKESLNQEFLENPELINSPEFFSRLKDVFIYVEYVGYLEREKKDISSLEVGNAKEINNYLRQINEKVEVTEDVNSSEEMIDLMIRIKQAFHESLGRIDAYERDHPNISDPVFEQAFQCRSGSETILNLMSEYSENTRSFKLVRIFTNGHQMPGFLDAENNLFGVESTTNGRGLVEFGNIENINIPIVVTDYRHDLASDIISDVSDDDIYIINNPSDVARNKAISESEMVAMKGVHSGRGFGFVDVPPGRRNLVKIDTIPSQRYNESFNYHADQDNLRSRLNISPEQAEKINIYNIQFQSELNNFWGKHADLFNNHPESRADFERQAKQLIVEIDSFLDSSGAEIQYQNLRSELEKDGKTLSMKGPYQTRDSILHNLNIRLNRY